MSSAKLSVAIICGGPSPERGISLNSARSVMDHLTSPLIEFIVLYVNAHLEFFQIDKNQLYSNTPCDFDFKLGKDLIDPISCLKKIDIVFPVIHGKYGEDGDLQEFLEKNGVPFVGSSSISCSLMFSKFNVNKLLQTHGFETTKLIRVEKQHLDLTEAQSLMRGSAKVVVKPDACGSSLCVNIADNLTSIIQHLNEIFSKGIDDVAVLEEFCEGDEFTVVVLQNEEGEPVALIPTQVEILSGTQIFDYRKKYLPTNAVKLHCPPKFSDEIVRTIMSRAERIFSLLGARDFVRIDGWVLRNNKIVFTDINPLSGLEQNSFIFQQSAWCGLTHKALLHYILQQACSRYSLKLPLPLQACPDKNVFVLFGGNSAERQVSLMSGTNVWLKLLHSQRFNPIPCLLDGKEVWLLPYPYTMSHTVEEIKDNCKKAEQIISRLKPYVNNIRAKLKLKGKYNIEPPRQLTLEGFVARAKSDFVFLALHGGPGEDGTIQKLLEESNISYNGSNSEVSKLCMNKYATGYTTVPGVTSLAKILCKVEQGELAVIEGDFTYSGEVLTYNSVCRILDVESFIIKPCNDGCSAGVVRINSQHELEQYLLYICSQEAYIPDGVFSNQKAAIELPGDAMLKDYIVESYIEVDTISVRGCELFMEKKLGWIEMTVGIVESHGLYHSFNPSITIAENSVLSLEEKFQGGTGVNLTPPPAQIVTEDQVLLIKKAIESLGATFRLQNYARVDIFFNRYSNQIILIEINTLPALTPSTVIFHQALAERKPLCPLEFIEKIISKDLIS